MYKYNKWKSRRIQQVFKRRQTDEQTTSRKQIVVKGWYRCISALTGETSGVWVFLFPLASDSKCEVLRLTNPKVFVSVPCTENVAQTCLAYTAPFCDVRLVCQHTIPDTSSRGKTDVLTLLIKRAHVPTRRQTRGFHLCRVICILKIQQNLMKKYLPPTPCRSKTQENERGVLLLPCRHLCVCTGCSERREISSCPLCRDTIAERLIVYS